MKYIITLVGLFLAQTLFSQDIGFMVQTAPLLQDYSSSIEFSPSSKVTKKQLEKWVEENSVSYPGTSSSEIMKRFVKAEYTSRFVYGANHVFARKLTFVKANQYNAYVAFWEHQEELAKEKQERDQFLGTLAFIGAGYLLYKGGKAIVKGVGEMLTTNVKTDTKYNVNSSDDYELISRTEGVWFSVSKYDIPSKDVNISIGCENYLHEVDKENDGFFASYTGSGNSTETITSVVDKSVLKENEIEFAKAPGILSVYFQNKKDKEDVHISIKIKTPGYYRIVVKPPQW